MTKSNKKGLGTIVSIVFLLLAMVGATVIIFNFYKSFSSEYKADLETQIDLETYINFNYIESNQIYYVNSHEFEITFDELMLIGESCSISGVLLPGDNNISLTDCIITTSDTYLQVLVRQNTNTHSEFVLFKDNY